MSYGIYTTELTASRKRRMPWRMVLEVAKAWNGVVFSGDGTDGSGLRRGQVDGVDVEYVNKPFTDGEAGALVARMKALGVTRLYYPIGPGRAYVELQRACDRAEIELIWYMSSSWNSLARVFRASRYLGIKATRPYWIQALIPKRNWIRRLTGGRVRHLITMTSYTGRMMVQHGYPEGFVHPILPGLDPVSQPVAGAGPASGKPYFLFFGPPQAIRGIYFILEAVKRLSDKRKDFVFVPLVRGDENARAEVEKLRSRIVREFGASAVGSAPGDCVVKAVFEALTPEEVERRVSGCVAVLKPFVLVPSEVPLAPMEAMQRGKLVLGFAGDGTGELIADHGVAVGHCDVLSLGQAMERCLDGGFSAQCARFDSWQTVSSKWELRGLLGQARRGEQ